MQFTPQQLQGAARYGSKTLIGNWYEEQCLDETKYADFRGERNQASSTQMRRYKFDKCKQRVPHSYSEDGCVRFGDTVIVQHAQTGGSVACDVFEPVTVGARECLVTVSPETRPTARNTFVVEPVTEPRLMDPYTEPSADGVLRYGEPFYLRCNDSLLVDERTDMLKPPMYLTSVLYSNKLSSRISNSQAVFVTKGRSSAAVWKSQKPTESKVDGVSRFLSRGEPVAANAPMVLLHRQTNVNLSADSKVTEGTDFGLEWEACCHNATLNGKRECLTSELSGLSTADTNALVELAQNKFIFITAQSPDDAVEFRNLPPPLTPGGLIKKVLQIISTRGMSSVRGLRRAFKVMDKGLNRLDRRDLKSGLVRYGVDLTDENFDILMDFFDKDGDGTVSLAEFMRALRGEMNERRIALIRMAYNVLDKTGDGLVTAKDVELTYDVSLKSEVINGQQTPAEAIREFMSLWDTQEADGVITFAEWEDYYRDISASIANDDEFELLIRNAWHISGGEGAAENSSNLRVLVTHSNNVQEVIEIIDDLGLDMYDYAAVKERLERQGVRDIIDINLSGMA
uniref:EF-hand domain-containing protein n=1 Tax=Phaeomonas parva TaxID=124430 RepID=A0A6U4K496_9STRA|mmetsp:Transcript_46334/g.144963  ORF Transcript_46334/g.144963 Transcript_46334/m.144963 type:complete len:569 (+) Transcript_46334:93-1799(+)|eukprot:CAMPEP_0118851640 /NCGR_PEP_ID=MMETSP1163-20130328/1000_1 /TAXON_ID=124430 /ORGANISM="Phaeomonas parva, Strain CCMP2877" /LENGTH=568 /DNA_ID=CAMNT_0006784013 /DNA_START=397 /DNA_END=2103 /DNA_ORIENTATION=+